MSEKKEIKISAAKGRPMLSWVGKRPLRHVTAFPAQHMETFAPVEKTSEVSKTSEVWNGWPASYPHGGLLFHGDNKEVLAHLLANGFRGKVKLIYIDPPFDSGADYVRKVQLRGGAATAKIEGESYNLGEQIQYTDIWANDNYLQFMYERLLLFKELLHENGSFVLHCDCSRSHHIRCLLDEVFGSDKQFKNELIWFYRRWPTNSKSFQSMHDNLYWYTKGNDNSHVFNKLYEVASERTLSDYGGKRLTTITSEEGTQIKRETEEDSLGVPMRDVWEIRREHTRSHEHTDYPTQKPIELIERIVTALSNEGDIVLDAFVGSGTTSVAAQKLGRRWISCDINKGAIQTTAKRLQAIIQDQIKAAEQIDLITTEESSPEPAQLSFGVWRVNDYDLKIQRNEAIKLACEHIGVERIASEGWFDGKLGKKLVKIIPFEHPLSPLDLEELKKELDARLEVENTIVFVCLGIELAARTWIEDWNRLRKGEHTVNKIEVIELRTDAKYGNFIKHEPATAKVSIMRDGDKIKVRIEDFISPTILKRLDMDLPLFKAKITDWRSQVDCVMIDTAYNGEVFNVTLSDVPEKKNDLIDGLYSLPAPTGKTTVAAKIIDMLGEEVLVVEKV
ncbi:MAG TPA: site-specific DNA-methyltransferase [Desulfuromonadales bacterium]|nr:site-specific DNA-methyltransferase [Desulfuromonadales bacterium]